MVNPSVFMFPFFDSVIYCHCILMVSYSSLTSDDIHNLLDEEVLSLSHPWDGNVPFPVFVVEDMNSFS